MDWVKFTVIYIILFFTYIQSTIGVDISDKNVTTTLYDYNIELDSTGTPRRLRCDNKQGQIQDLSDKECSLLKVFNQTEVDLMKPSAIKYIAETCACQLLFITDKWHKFYFGSFHATKQVAKLVEMSTNETLHRNHTFPSYFWTDLDIVAYRVSVYTSTRDYFHKLKSNIDGFRLSENMRKLVAKDRIWRMIGTLCKRISQDDYFTFRYLENLARLDPSVFFRLVFITDYVGDVYQASKACKLLLLLHLNDYKLRPDDENIVIANRNDGQTSGPEYNLIEDTGDEESSDIETMIFKAKSLMPNNCNKINRTTITTTTTTTTSTEEEESHSLGQHTHPVSLCPIEFNQGDTGDNVKVWLANNVTAPTIRSMAAVQCGCQLLLYNSIWENMMNDPDVALMAKALTNYLNTNRVPDVASSPPWVLHGWFKDIMWNLTKSRKGPIKEVIKIKRGGEEDSTKYTHSDSGSEALDLLRRGCLVVVHNYDKAAKRKGRFRLVHYLDDLQLISSDPIFVFQLALQDLNLFKIYALSKMCQPIM